MGLTTNGLPYPDDTYSVDVVRDIKNLADSVDAKALAVHNAWGAPISGVTDAAGVLGFAHGAPWTPTWAVVSLNYAALGDVTASILSAGIQSIGSTYIQFRFRNESSHQFYPGGAVSGYVVFGR